MIFQNPTNPLKHLNPINLRGVAIQVVTKLETAKAK